MNIQGFSSAYNQPAAPTKLPESRAEQAARGVEPMQSAMVQAYQSSLLNQPAPPTRLPESRAEQAARAVAAVNPMQSAVTQAYQSSSLNQPAAAPTRLHKSTARRVVAVKPKQPAIVQAYQSSSLNQPAAAPTRLPESRAEQAARGVAAVEPKQSALAQLGRRPQLNQTNNRIRRTTAMRPYDNRRLIFTELDQDAILAMQSRIQESNRHDKLELHDLVKHGLVPNKKITISETNYFCSTPFRSKDHVLAIVLVEIGNKVYPRIFYQSNSQCIWRVLPHGPKDENSNLIEFGKGENEHSLHAPSKLSIALNSMQDILSNESFSFSPFIEEDKEDEPEILGETKIAGGIEPKTYRGRIPSPKDIKLPVNDPGFHPDFTRPMEKIQQTLVTYGDVTVETYPSKNRIYTYMIIIANDGKAFLAGVENTDAPINKFGIRSISPNTAAMTSSLLEYLIQIKRSCLPRTICHPYGDNKDYITNWNYVRELEVIKLYYESLGKEVPPSV